MRRKLTYQDIPLWSGAETRKSQEPLILAWKARFSAGERIVRVRPMDYYDVHGGYPQAFSEMLDQDDERSRSERRETRWFVSETSHSCKQADQELGWIHNLYLQAVEGWQTRYQRWQEKLRNAGYKEEDIASVPEPPREIPLLHVTFNGCGTTGAIWEGKFGEETTFRLYCQHCGWIQRFYFDRGEPVTPEMLHDQRPVTMPSNPDFPEFRFASKNDEGETEEEKQLYLARTRRCLKAAGELITISKAAEILGCTTNNISNYIGRHRLGAWPDPDDTVYNRYRLVLRREVEDLR